MSHRPRNLWASRSLSARPLILYEQSRTIPYKTAHPLSVLSDSPWSASAANRSASSNVFIMFLFDLVDICLLPCRGIC